MRHNNQEESMQNKQRNTAEQERQPRRSRQGGKQSQKNFANKPRERK